MYISIYGRCYTTANTKKEPHIVLGSIAAVFNLHRNGLYTTSTRAHTHLHRRLLYHEHAG